jgi:hypothetical protein
MIIVSRKEWGARYADGDYADGPKSAPLPAREVWLHHSDTKAPDLIPPFDDEDAAMRHLEDIGQQRFGCGVSYTFAVMPSGRIYEGHAIDRRGTHTKNRNGIARAIVLVGNYGVDDVTGEQREAVAELMAHGRAAGWWRSEQLAGGHRQAPGAATECPGQYGMAAIPDINQRALAISAGAPTDTPEDGFLSALSPGEQRHMYDLLELAFSPEAGKPPFAVRGQVTLSLAKIEGGLATILANQAAAGAAVDVDDLADRIVGGMGDHLAQQLLDGIARRLGTAAAAAPAHLVADVDQPQAVNEHQADVDDEEPAGEPPLPFSSHLPASRFGF